MNLLYFSTRICCSTSTASSFKFVSTTTTATTSAAATTTTTNTPTGEFYFRFLFLRKSGKLRWVSYCLQWFNEFFFQYHSSTNNNHNINHNNSSNHPNHSPRWLSPLKRPKLNPSPRSTTKRPVNHLVRITIIMGHSTTTLSKFYPILTPNLSL